MTSLSEKYKICLIGSGGVGTIASIALEKSGLAFVTVVLRSKYAAVKERGWDVESIDHGSIKGWRPSRVVPTVVDAVTMNKDGSEEEEEMAAVVVVYDYVVVCTKQLPTQSPVAEIIRPVVTPGHTAIVLIQNGTHIENPVIEAFPTNVVMSSVSHIGAEVRDPNIAIQTGKDNQKIGPHFHSGVDDAVSLKKAQEFVEMYRKGEAPLVSLTEEIGTARWEKLLWNGTFNTVCALMRMNVGELQRSKGRESMLIPMMWEIHSIAKAAGHEMPESIVQWMAYRLPDDCDYRPSMLLDLEYKRPMELEVILGNALATAQKLDVAVPIMSSVYNLLKLEEWKITQANKLNAISSPSNGIKH